MPSTRVRRRRAPTPLPRPAPAGATPGARATAAAGRRRAAKLRPNFSSASCTTVPTRRAVWRTQLNSISSSSAASGTSSPRATTSAGSTGAVKRRVNRCRVWSGVASAGSCAASVRITGSEPMSLADGRPEIVQQRARVGAELHPTLRVALAWMQVQVQRLARARQRDVGQARAFGACAFLVQPLDVAIDRIVAPSSSASRTRIGAMSR